MDQAYATLVADGDRHGQADTAHKAWQQALDLREEFHHPAATDLRAKPAIG